MKKDDDLLLDIVDLGANGEGIAHVDNQTIFVPYALVGEKVSAKVDFCKNGIAFTHLKKVITQSPHRVAPPCEVFGECGGCQLQHLAYEQQLELKRANVSNNFKKIAKLDVTCDNVIWQAKYGYRNKLQMPISQIDGKLAFGFYKNSTHDIIEVDKCILHGDWCGKLINIVKTFAEENGILGYCESDDSGLLKHLVARYINKQLMVCLVIFGETLPNHGQLYKALKEKFSSVSLYININKVKNNVILGKKYVLLGGEKSIKTNVLWLKVEVQPASFMQINDGIRDKIYSTALSKVGRTNVLIDAYSGAGVLSALLAGKFEQVTGIEIVKEAVEDAQALVKANNISNCNFVLGDCSQELGKVAKAYVEQGKTITLIVDPPRKGCDKSVIEAIANAKPDYLLYISCNSATLARDIAYLLDLASDYALSPPALFDMFPQTKHVECVVLMSRKQ
ncbi:MAG: 23S rRNA (uracil(1939)-C(5))-methyltransferase RlmD [Clostridia bacterium]